MSAKKKGRFGNNRKISSSRRKLIIAITAACILLVASIIVLIFLMKDESMEQQEHTTVPTKNVVENTAYSPTETDASEITEREETTAPEEMTNPAETTKPVETTKPQETQTGNQTQTPSPNNPSTQTPATQPQVTQPPKTVLSLPYVIPGTDLVIQRVASYDGVFLEDGSNAEVTGVAMMLLYNMGDEAVEYADITMTYDDKVLCFEASALPAGGVVAVQEANQSSCASGDLVECTADVAVIEKMGMSEDQISVVDNGDNSITVTNLTGNEIVTVRIFYKYFMEEEDAYVGGITYTAKISNLAGNAAVLVTPSHYASGASEVVMVRTYDVDA